MSETVKRRPVGLGRGLNALLGDATPPSLPDARGQVREVRTESVRPAYNQPRKHFAEEALTSLTESIRVHGVLQPIVVRAGGGYNEFIIVAGERRWRAASQLGLPVIPAIVREFDDRAQLAVAIVENIQREQLNAIEEGQAYRRLIDEFGQTQEEVAASVHKSRSHVANLIRLLDLPKGVQDQVAEGKLTMGHARALLAAPAAEVEAFAAQVVERQLTVRATEALAGRKRSRPKSDDAPRQPRESNEDLMMLERQIGDILGLKVAISHQDPSGTVTLSYGSLEQLDMICQRLSGERI